MTHTTLGEGGMVNGGRELRGRYLVFEGVKKGAIRFANQVNIFWSQSASDIKPWGGDKKK
jgi:hypothetical protein